MTERGIKIQGLHKVYGKGGSAVTALEEVDLDIKEREFLAIVGPSGCGKTTLLRILAGLTDASGGTVDFDLNQGDRPLQSMVFQEQGVFPWMTVLENACFGQTVRGIERKTREAAARHFLRKLGLEHFEDKYPHQLSGGMRQRVNLARAFTNDPAMLLMDEPLAALDEQTRMVVQDDLLHLWEETHKTVIFITHSLDEALVLADRVAVMSFRPARIKAIFDVNIPRPRNALELRNDPEFVDIRHQVWEVLRAEVLAAQHREQRT